MRWLLLILALSLAPFKAAAEDGPVRLHAPAALVDTGLFDYILPRFTLKHRVRVALVDTPADAHIILGPDGRPLFTGPAQTWAMDIRDADHPGTATLADWLTDEIGRNTILAYAPEGDALFSEAETIEPETATADLSGDPALGLRISKAKCTRCHAVDDSTRMAGIGSTPSFAVLRSLPDWEQRFAAFYVLNPHPSFTQIAEVTPPFDDQTPSPIVPMEMTLDEVDAVLAYVAAMDAADLGAPLQHQ
ncbi:hypothetical protein [Roseovarius sp.]|uniref:hypothetical protein n=1 Tax=Roseovarius sp. TaxID=1486281 RepID=UPI003BAC2E98